MAEEAQDRRVTERQSVSTSLWISGPERQEYEPLSVNDVGLGGLSFRSAVAWTEDDWVRIFVHVDEPLTLPGRVLWCRRREAGASALPVLGHEALFDVGVAFDDTDVERRRALVGEIFRSEVYNRGLYG